MNPWRPEYTEEHSSAPPWLSSNLLVIKIGWRLVPRCEHVTLGLFRWLIRREVTAADSRGRSSRSVCQRQAGWGDDSQSPASSTSLPLLSYRVTMSITFLRYHQVVSEWVKWSDLRGYLLIILHLHDSGTIKAPELWKRLKLRKPQKLRFMSLLERLWKI